jgi:hypothetical protein
VYKIYASAVVVGSVRREDGAWSLRVDIGLDPATGRRRRVLRQGFTTKKAAEAALENVLHAAGRGSLPTPSRLSLGAYLEAWLVTQSDRLQPTRCGATRSPRGGSSGSLAMSVCKR